MGVLDPLINVVKGIPQNHNFWNGPIGKALGLVQNVAANNQNIGRSQGQLAASMVPGIADTMAGPFSSALGNVAKRVLPSGALQRMQVDGIATTPAQTRQMVANIPGGVVNGVKSFMQHPVQSMYENPVSTAMAVIAPMASPELSAAKVNLANSLRPGMADLNANLGPVDPGLAGQSFVDQGGEPQTQFNGFSQSGPENQALRMYKALHPDASQAAIDRFMELHPGGVYQQPRTIPAFTPAISGPATQALSEKMDALQLIRALKGGGPFNGSAAFKNYMVSQVANSLKK